MSLDLTLLPYTYHEDNLIVSTSDTILPLQSNNRDLMDEIEKVSKQQQQQSIDFINDGKKYNGVVEDDFTCYLARDDEGEHTYGTLTETPYGNPLLWVRVSELLKIDKALWRNQKDIAALAYISTMHKDHKIALYWS